MGIMDEAARKREILEKIRKIRMKITAANRVKNSLSTANSSISSEISNWNTKYSNFQADTMSAVVVTDKFEGDTAEKIKEKLPDSIDAMTDTKTSAEGVQSEIGEQISRLDTYIANLTAEISALEGGYAAV